MAGPVQTMMHARLTAALAPERLAIHDDSARHAGHAGARPEGETHFTVEIVSRQFDGLDRVQRQRLVHGALAAELAGPVHALSLVCRTPAEDAS
jgi:BolA protein